MVLCKTHERPRVKSDEKVWGIDRIENNQGMRMFENEIERERERERSV